MIYSSQVTLRSGRPLALNPLCTSGLSWGEVLAGMVLYVLTHSFKFLFGFIILSIIGNVGMKVAWY
ncbi:hypothetical protein SGGMMB4_05807 (plasmid) [Sodalis glossinidius str. 'morsitans']|uniref:Pilin n=1 Tax=Sodalis glossinidius (strain morsitans) TaxID=343509 RepID=Q2NQ45_SODGM|nr:type IV conjugative transfer system pilin TraA [Sodalis glossinidius]BAE75730.1 hypothetical protein SGP1_0023 [Sodalis glossinidius str. 'morsitans']CAI59286.1 TraA protein [Sodalis glossinidius]CAI59459.1 TraA protein [Sodalis glossinidius]CRL46843.1 hypothetical protein SGGMMB4_05807 [Sodalis glossinidius str. 'morsitans']